MLGNTRRVETTGAEVARGGEYSFSLALARLAATAAARIETVLAADDLRLEDWRVLAQLRHGPSTMSDLARDVLLTGPTLTRTIDKLATRGLVHRTPSKVDRRKVVVHLSPVGQSLHEQLEPAVTDAERAALRTDPADRELRRLITLLLAN